MSPIYSRPFAFAPLPIAVPVHEASISAISPTCSRISISKRALSSGPALNAQRAFFGAAEFAAKKQSFRPTNNFEFQEISMKKDKHRDDDDEDRKKDRDDDDDRAVKKEAKRLLELLDKGEKSRSSSPINGWKRTDKDAEDDADDRPTETALRRIAAVERTAKNWMADLDEARVSDILGEIVKYELSGVIRYTHYGLVIRGPNRIPLIQFFKDQATESLLHAQQAGEILTGIGGVPAMMIAPIEETKLHSVYDVLAESYEHEAKAISFYRLLLEEVEGKSVYLEEYARSQIAAEEVHRMELRKMLRDYST